MKNGLLIFILLAFLAACQQPTVYIFSENLQDEQRQQLDAVLKAQSLPYEYVELEVPREFGAATLMLANDKIFRTQTQQLAAIMQTLGYQPEISYTTRANHFYGDGNIGFYLKNVDADKTFTMPKALRTSECEKDEHNDLAVSFTPQHAQFTLASGAKVVLEWEYLYGYLVIYYSNYSQTYTHAKPLVATPFGLKPSDRYSITAHVNKPSWLNCSLQVVYMD